MKIELKIDVSAEWQEVELYKEITIEDLYLSLEEKVKYPVLAAKVNNRIEDLNYIITEPCKVEFLDLRSKQANLIYQYSLSLIYLKAVYDVIGDYPVEIKNSLNKGIYTEIDRLIPISKKEVREIEKRMYELVLDRAPFVREEVSIDQAMRILDEDGRVEKKSLLKDIDAKTVTFYSLEGYRDFFYGYMVPNTGYIDKFEVIKYGRGVIIRFPHPSDPLRVPPYEDQQMLYDAFEEQTVWDGLLGVTYVADLNKQIENGEYKELIQLSEALHEKKIAQIADMIKRRKKRIILIAGPSSSGKTTFARRLCVQLRVNGMKPLYLGTDDYFLDRVDTPLDENGEKDFENLRALDIQLFNDNMNDLLAGKEVDLPTFDFIEGKKIFGKRITSLEPGQPVVIEGIHGLNEELTKFISYDAKFKIYISPLTQMNIDAHNRIPSTDERMLRRIVRDYLYRGHDAKSTIKSWPKVRAGEDKNIFPYSEDADVFFNSYHAYEISVLKKYAEPLLRQIGHDEKEYAEAVRMLEFLQFFKTIDDDSIIVNNSIIREFIGGSIFID